MNVPVLPGTEFRVPEPYAKLYDLAYNLWWSWEPSANDLWRHLDPKLWERYRNPIEVLSAVEPATWQALDASELFPDLYNQATRRFKEYMEDRQSWWERQGSPSAGPVAYLCAEYGVHTSLPLYSGGLGVLAGDHTKAASDLGVPFVGTGLLYRRGYFRQEIDAEGDQQHTYPHLDVSRLPIRPVAGPTGGQLKVSVDFPGRTVHAAVWNLQVGRVPLLLLDTDIPDNEPADRPITSTLYVRGREMRFCQEMLLGVGSVKALAALGIEPAVWHVNEGHAAMSLLERLAVHVREGRARDEAEKLVRAKTLFTLHTPVPAGNEAFDVQLVEKYLSHWPAQVGADIGYLMGLGSSDGVAGRFDLGALAIRLSSFVNGVSERHASVVSRDWAHLLSGPAPPVTNGVHTPSWVGRELGRLFADAIAPNWPIHLVEQPDSREAVHGVADEDIWAAHVARKQLLSRFARGRIRSQLARQGSSPDELRAVERMLPADRLTIGFARRFTTYKRATLMFHNIPWLQAILTNPERPVQVVFAGKAHPADRHGQELIRRIVELARTPELRGHVYVLEDYDMRMARFLVQGVDVWLNNPRPPQEASGTSGMKAGLNGALNLSILDGWWVEGHRDDNGWVFGLDWDTGDPGAQDNEDAVSLYNVLQDEVIPLYYTRDEAGLPREWIRMMKESIASSVAAFSTHRMVKDYAQRAYLPLGAGPATAAGA